MQLFSADTTMFFFFDHKKLKKPPSKVAHNRPKPFFPQTSPSQSQQPKIDFSYHKNVPATSEVTVQQHKCNVLLLLLERHLEFQNMILIFSIPMGADYSFELISIETYAPNLLDIIDFSLAVCKYKLLQLLCTVNK